MQSSGIFFALEVFFISLMTWNPLIIFPKTYFMAEFQTHSMLPHENAYTFLLVIITFTGNTGKGIW